MQHNCTDAERRHGDLSAIAVETRDQQQQHAPQCKNTDNCACDQPTQASLHFDTHAHLVISKVDPQAVLCHTEKRTRHDLWHSPALVGDRRCTTYAEFVACFDEFYERALRKHGYHVVRDRSTRELRLFDRYPVVLIMYSHCADAQLSHLPSVGFVDDKCDIARALHRDTLEWSIYTNSVYPCHALLFVMDLHEWRTELQRILGATGLIAPHHWAEEFRQGSIFSWLTSVEARRTDTCERNAEEALISQYGEFVLRLLGAYERVKDTAIAGKGTLAYYKPLSE